MKKEDLKNLLGARESGEDERDLPFAFRSIEKVEIPDEFSLKDQFLGIRHQYETHACTAFASTSIIEALQKIACYISPRDIYCRRSNTSTGMSLRDACKLLKKEGSCLEICFPFVSNNAILCTPEPCANAKSQRSTHRITSYHRIYTSIIDTLWQEKTPILVAVPIYENWQHIIKGTIPTPDGSSYIGLHAITIIGWKKIGGKTYYEFRNSWSKEWGDKGYGYLPLSYPIHEAWTMKTDETNGGDTVQVQSWQIGKKNLFGVKVTFAIYSTIKCRAILAINGVKKGAAKYISAGVRHASFNIPFELNVEIDIELTFTASSGFRKHEVVGMWKGTLKTEASIK